MPASPVTLPSSPSGMLRARIPRKASTATPAVSSKPPTEKLTWAISASPSSLCSQGASSGLLAVVTTESTVDASSSGRPGPDRNSGREAM